MFRYLNRLARYGSPGGKRLMCFQCVATARRKLILLPSRPAASRPLIAFPLRERRPDPRTAAAIKRPCFENGGQPISELAGQGLLSDRAKTVEEVRRGWGNRFLANDSSRLLEPIL